MSLKNVAINVKQLSKFVLRIDHQLCEVFSVHGERIFTCPLYQITQTDRFSYCVTLKYLLQQKLRFFSDALSDHEINL